MLTRITSHYSAILECDAPACAASTTGEGDTLQAALQAATGQGWLVWMGRCYCPLHHDAYPPGYLEFGGTLAAPKTQRLPVLLKGEEIHP